MTFKMYGIPCKLSKPTMIYLILFLVNLGITNGFECFLIIQQNFVTVIEAIFFAMLDLSRHLQRISTT
jgi:hypothetical protein